MLNPWNQWRKEAASTKRTVEEYGAPKTTLQDWVLRNIECGKKPQ